MIEVEVEYTGPRLRGLLVMLLSFIAAGISYLGLDDPDEFRWESLGFIAVSLAGIVMLMVDERRWKREKALREQQAEEGDR